MRRKNNSSNVNNINNGSNKNDNFQMNGGIHLTVL